MNADSRPPVKARTDLTYCFGRWFSPDEYDRLAAEWKRFKLCTSRENVIYFARPGGFPAAEDPNPCPTDSEEM